MDLLELEKIGITYEEMAEELKSFYDEDFSNLSNFEIETRFLKHVSENSEEVTIEKIFNEYSENKILAHTPDGFQEIGDFYKKKERECFLIKTSGGLELECSGDHLIETTGGWVLTSVLNERLSSGDSINVLTQNGIERLVFCESQGIKGVFDIEILHPNKRYYAQGISSHNTGKSFVCLNVVREAQKKGYDVVYCDTEGAIDKSSALKFGIDANKIRYQPIKTVSQFQTFVANLVDMVNKARAKGEAPKILLILDSLGMLSTDKEIADAIRGHNAADMGAKAKELRKLFRVITLDLTAAKIPLICTNHVYCLTAGHKILMSDGQYKNIEDIKVGDMVQTLAGDKPVCSTSEFEDKEVIKLTLENGQTIECTPNHKFLVENEWTKEQSWKRSDELEEGDYILRN